MAKIDDLKTKANAVAGATQVGENTAARVGGALQDAASCIEELQKSLQSNNQSDADRDKIVGELKTSLISLWLCTNILLVCRKTILSTTQLRTIIQ